MADVRAYAIGLKMLAGRDLSESQLRERLTRRQCDSADIDEAIERLREERALDDRRVALARARSEAQTRHRGRARVVRQIESLGIARDVARAAVAEVFADIDEESLLQQALDKRLRRGASLKDQPTVRRIHRFLIAQGFDPSRVTSVLRSRAKGVETREHQS